MNVEKENKELAKRLEAFYAERHKETWDIPVELISVEQPIEQVVKLDAYRKVVEDGRKEIIAELAEAGVEVKSEIFPYKTRELRSGIEYELSEFGWLVIYGIEVIQGAGDFKMSIPASSGIFIFRFVANGETHLLSPMTVIVPEGTDFAITSPNEEELKYKIVGTGYNNLTIEEIVNLYKKGAGK